MKATILFSKTRTVVALPESGESESRRPPREFSSAPGLNKHFLFIFLSFSPFSNICFLLFWFSFKKSGGGAIFPQFPLTPPPKYAPVYLRNGLLPRRTGETCNNHRLKLEQVKIRIKLNYII